VVRVNKNYGDYTLFEDGQITELKKCNLKVIFAPCLSSSALTHPGWVLLQNAERRGGRVHAGKWEEMFGVREEEVVEEVKVKRPRKKAVVKKVDEKKVKSKKQRQI